MRSYATAAMLLALFICTALPCNAGKNSGGALVVHATPDQITYTFPCVPYNDVWCDDQCYQWLAPASCEETRTQSNFVDPSGISVPIVWLLAAFPEGSNPGVSAISFGLVYPYSPGLYSVGEVCGPEGTYEISDDGWPTEWETAGTTVYFGEPIVGETFFMFYYFYVYGDETYNYFGTGIHPGLGRAEFVSDDEPPVYDECTRFGQLRWFEPGFNDCPEPLSLGACCFDDGGCEPLYEYRCFEAGGIEWISGEACEPENPCVPTVTEWTTLGVLKSRHH